MHQYEKLVAIPMINTNAIKIMFRQTELTMQMPIIASSSLLLANYNLEHDITKTL